MLEDIKAILDSNITTAAGAVVIVFMLRPILAVLVSGWIEDRKAQRKLEADRNDNERAQTATMRQLGDQLDLSLTTQRQIADLIGKLAVMPTQLKGAVDMMVARCEQRDQVLADVVATQRVIRAGVGDGEGEAWAEDGPRLAAIQTLLAGALSSIEERIVRRLDPARPDARAIVREELQGVIDQLNLARRLEQLGAELQQLKQGSARPQGGDNQRSEADAQQGGGKPTDG